MQRRHQFIMIVIATLVSLAAACGDDAEVLSVSLEAARDNTLYENPSGERSNGSGEHLFLGATNALRVRRAVMAFDVESAIPAGAEIRGVTLTLEMNRSRNADERTVTLHRLLADWGEGASDALDTEGPGVDSEPGDATWLHRFFEDQLWASEGGDFEESVSASLEVGGVGSYTWESTDELVDDVQTWLDDPAANFGWIIRGDEVERGTSKRFHSREAADATVRPTLVIEYVAPE